MTETKTSTQAEDTWWNVTDQLSAEAQRRILITVNREQPNNEELQIYSPTFTAELRKEKWAKDLASPDPNLAMQVPVEDLVKAIQKRITTTNGMSHQTLVSYRQLMTPGQTYNTSFDCAVTLADGWNVLQAVDNRTEACRRTAVKYPLRKLTMQDSNVIQQGLKAIAERPDALESLLIATASPALWTAAVRMGRAASKAIESFAPLAPLPQTIVSTTEQMNYGQKDPHRTARDQMNTIAKWEIHNPHLNPAKFTTECMTWRATEMKARSTEQAQMVIANSEDSRAHEGTWQNTNQYWVVLTNLYRPKTQMLDYARDASAVKQTFETILLALQAAAHDNKTLLNEFINKPVMFVNRHRAYQLPLEAWPKEKWMVFNRTHKNQVTQALYPVKDSVKVDWECLPRAYIITILRTLLMGTPGQTAQHLLQKWIEELRRERYAERWAINGSPWTYMRVLTMVTEFAGATLPQSVTKDYKHIFPTSILPHLAWAQAKQADRAEGTQNSEHQEPRSKLSFINRTLSAEENKTVRRYKTLLINV